MPSMASARPATNAPCRGRTGRTAHIRAGMQALPNIMGNNRIAKNVLPNVPMNGAIKKNQSDGNSNQPEMNGLV